MTIFNHVMRTPPEGGEKQEMLAIAKAIALINPLDVPDGNGVVMSLWAQAESSTSIVVAIGSESKTVSVGTAWQRLDCTFSTDSTISITVSENVIVYLYKAKLEIGNKMTDWSPAPEDADYDISLTNNKADRAQESANNAQTSADQAQATADTAKAVTDEVEMHFDFISDGLDIHTPTSTYDMLLTNDGYRVRQKIETGEIRVRQMVRGGATTSPEYRVGEPDSTGKLFGMRVAPDGGIMFALED